MLPDLSMEEAAWSSGCRWVAGVDEAGRGAWAGPVAAAAVILPADCPDLCRRLAGVRDSKMLSQRQRERLLEVVRREAVAVGVGMADTAVIVAEGIVEATRRAMAAAIGSLSRPPDYLLIDYLLLPQLATPQSSVTRGDQKSLSIAAASIVAKVSRDRLMVELAEDYPGYGFQRHKGYGTQAHRAALAENGVTPLHRHTWRPFLRFSGEPSAGEAA